MKNKPLLFINRKNRGYPPGAFVFEVDTMETDRIEFFYNAEEYDYEILVGKDIVASGITQDYDLVFDEPGIYQVGIRGKFPSLIITNEDTIRIKKILQWGNVVWQALLLGNNISYAGLEIWAKDIPKFSESYTPAGFQFYSVPGLIDVGGRMKYWDIRNVDTLDSAFFECYQDFNVDMNLWDFGNVTSISNVLRYCSSYNRNILWNTHNVINMISAFEGIKSEQINLLCENVTNATGAFYQASELKYLYLWDMSVNFSINTNDLLIGGAIDDLAYTVADLSGKTSATVTMTPTQKASCDQALWTAKNWTIS